ncbi:retrotransposon protein, putative, ty1-copia subclass, partial [Tanacetum coccineum]
QGLKGSKKLKLGALNQYVGNGHRAAIEAIGNLHLCLLSGLVVILNNYHYAPSITRGIISLSILKDNGFVNCFIVWGCEALVKRDTLTKPDKLEPRSVKCIFVGYLKETSGYCFYYPPKNKVLVARNAEFFENSLITQEASESLEDLEIIQDEDTYPSKNTSLHHDEDDQEIDEPQSDIIPIRRSTRIRHALDRMCLYVDAEEHELGDLNEPANYKAALLDPESDKWITAINVEIQSMKDNQV